MASPVHMLPYRPLVGGVAVHNPKAGGLGSLGLVATSDGVDRWIVSAYHVLGRPVGSEAEDGEPIFQPAGLGNAAPIARLVRNRCDPALDLAAARLEAGVAALGWILGIGPVQGVVDPLVGMRVVKSGMATGITEGVVAEVNGDDVRISAPSEYAASYDVAMEGDSGSVWVDIIGRRAVALHTSSMLGSDRAKAIRVASVLARLGLSL